jgi:sulfite reductase (NADPH) flavoprotein alpha-component
VYTTGFGNLPAEFAKMVARGDVNVAGRVPLIEIVETRPGAGAIAAGAQSVGTRRVAVILSSQNLPKMVGPMMKIAATKAPCVFHASAQSVTSDLAIQPEIGGVLACRNTGFAIVASYSPQEILDLAVVSHEASVNSSSPVLHIFDGDLSRTSTHVRSVSGFKMSAPKPTYTATAAEGLRAAMSRLSRQYKFFEYHGAEDATQIIVIFGNGATAAKELAVNMADTCKIGVVVVRVYRPWDAAAFLAALPATVARVVATVVSSEKSTASALLADVLGSFHSAAAASSVHVTSATIVPEQQGCTREKMAALFDRLLSDEGVDLANNIRKMIEVTDADADSAVVPTLPTAGGAAAMCIWGSKHVEEVVGCVQSALAAENLFAWNRVDRDAYHPQQPVRSWISFSNEKFEAGPTSTSCCNLVVVNDVALLASHGVEIVSSLNPAATSILAVSLDQGSKGATPVNVSECLSKLLGQVPRMVKVVAFSAAKFAAEYGTEVATSAIILSLFQSGAPGLHFDYAGAVGSMTATGGAERLWKEAPLAPEDITSELQHLDEDPDNLDDTTVTLAHEEQRSLISRIPSPPSSPNKKVGNSNAKEVSQEKVAWSWLFNDDLECAEAFRPYEPREVFQVKLTKNERLTPADYHRNVFHMEFDTTGTSLKYSIGESLGVYGQNDLSEVEGFLQFYGVNPDQFVSMVPDQNRKGSGRKEELLTVRQIFQQRLDLFGKPSQEFYAALVPYATSKYQQKRLKWLGSEDKEGARLRNLEFYTFADVLMEFKTAHPPLINLIQLIPPIKPRHYSISSSMKMHPNSVHLLVVAVEWDTPKGRKRFGQCTRDLASLDLGAVVTVDIMTSVMKLPEDHTQPVIGAALGTGLAPFRAFIQERTMLKREGKTLGPFVMYFGARYRAQEYLYGDDLDAAAKDGIISHLRLAFSRDSAKKVYIQHLIEEDRAQLSDYFLNDGGHFYLCGPTWPVPDVKKALCDGMMAGPGTSITTQDEADDFIERLKGEGRYVLEVY